MTSLFSRIQQAGAALAVVAASVSFSPDADAHGRHGHGYHSHRGGGEVCASFRAHSDHGSAAVRGCTDTRSHGRSHGHSHTRGHGWYDNRNHGYRGYYDRNLPSNRLHDAHQRFYERQGYRGYFNGHSRGHGHRRGGPEFHIGAGDRNGSIHLRFRPD